MKILVADDDKNLSFVLTTELREFGFEADSARTGLETLESLETGEYDVLLLDLNMPGLGGMEVLKSLSSLDVPPETIILTGNATVSTAVEAMKFGAYDYVSKPFKMDELKALVEKAYEKKTLRGENVILKTQLKRQWDTQRIVTVNPLMLEILQTVKKVALSNFPVLVHGESGVGKELVAKSIHDASLRPSGPFIAINCGAIPETMLEAELFGHERGAFTGAHARKLGLIEIANNGTLFLDEIGELPLALQGKLLRVIESGVFFRIGGLREIKVGLKLVSATNKDLKAEVDRGAFRADLYYRISALGVHIPPLRERRDDIPVLINHFVKLNPAFKGKGFSKEAMELLEDYPWPGNIRELQNVVHRTLLLARGDIAEPEDLPKDMLRQVDGAAKNTGRTLEEIEREHILRVMHESGGQRGRAAEILGIDPKTLYRKLISYGVKE